MALATMGSSVLGKFTELFVDYLVFPVGRQFGYLFCYKTNIKNLTEHVKDLENVEAGVKRRADAAERNLEIVGEDVQDWQKKAIETTNDANKVLERRAEVERGCLNGWCPNLLVRYSLSRNAKKTSEKLVELQNKGNEYTSFAYPAPPMQKIVITEDCKDFDSRMTTTKEVMDALEDDEIRMIGICGMPGVGKTTMVQEVAKRVEVKKLFDEVVMAVVSNNPDSMKIQSDLADMLDLKFETDETSFLRANKLRTRLSNGKKILVILDDVWKELKLEELGTPFGVGQHRCKVLLTSRNEHVCVEMESQKEFVVKLLSEDEAWYLFKEKAGIEDDNTELQPVAKDVADECRGLPLAIVTLAKALKRKEKNSWNVTLRLLRRNTEIPAKVETAIKLSYDMLEKDESKSLLRLCSLYPEDYKIPIECLVRYAVGLRLLENVETVLQARETVYSLIDQLKSCHLILVGDEESVKLHDVVRDVCISIASKGKDAYLVRCDASLKKWPQEETFRHYSAISMMLE